MQRFIGLLLTLVGAVSVLWAGYYVLVGESGARLYVTDDFSLTAMTGGLAGVAIFTMGLIWMRD